MQCAHAEPERRRPPPPTPPHPRRADYCVLRRACSALSVLLRFGTAQNEEFLKELKFGIGDGRLQYYIYNWRTAEITPQQVGLVLL